MNRNGLLKVPGLVVIKLGTGILLSSDNRINKGKTRYLVDDIAVLRQAGYRFVLVSSGAIGMGMRAISQDRRPNRISDVQALAAIGQTLLMQEWTQLFAKHSIHVGQILLNHDVIDNRQRTLHALDCIHSLIYDYDTIPIINENDTVATVEIRFGDNDYLSALTASLLGADALIIYSDVDGLYEKNPKLNNNAGRIDYVDVIDKRILEMADDKNSELSRGGMRSKIHAAKSATETGTHVIIAGGDRFKLKEILAGEPIGTFFKKQNTQINPRKKWILSNRQAKGRIIVDDGAKMAIVRGHGSLLAKGIVACEGEFGVSDMVKVADRANKVFAKGIVYYNNRELARICGKDSRDFADLVETFKEEVIDRNNLIITEAHNEDD